VSTSMDDATRKLGRASCPQVPFWSIRVNPQAVLHSPSAVTHGQRTDEPVPDYSSPFVASKPAVAKSTALKIRRTAPLLPPI
jgi:hypothetical protein